MSEEVTNQALMLSVLEAVKDGNLEPLFEALSPDVTWIATAPKDFFRFGGTYHGLSGMKEYTALLFSRYHFVRLQPKVVTAKADQVWGIFEAEVLHQPSGRYVQSDLSIRWTVKDGKIVEHQGFFDTASVLMQQGELKTQAA
jgi:ketosteroid isomerase-like protein